MSPVSPVAAPPSVERARKRVRKFRGAEGGIVSGRRCRGVASSRQIRYERGIEFTRSSPSSATVGLTSGRETRRLWGKH